MGLALTTHKQIGFLPGHDHDGFAQGVHLEDRAQFAVLFGAECPQVSVQLERVADQGQPAGGPRPSPTLLPEDPRRDLGFRQAQLANGLDHRPPDQVQTGNQRYALIELLEFIPVQ